MSSSSSSSTTLIKSMASTTIIKTLALLSLILIIPDQTSAASLHPSPNSSNTLKTLQASVELSTKLNNLLLAGSGTISTEQQMGALEDCIDLHGISLSVLKKSVSDKRLSTDDIKTYLSAALTNKATCLEGLASGPGNLADLVAAIVDAYSHVSDALSLISHMAGRSGRHRQRQLIGDDYPQWVDRRILEGPSGKDYDPGRVITVAADGSGNFTSLTDAIQFAPNNSPDRIIVYVKAGVYAEKVDVPSYKTNIVLLGDGADVTVVTWNDNVKDRRWTTFKSATVGVAGEGFLARGITFENSAGPKKDQAVAFRANADRVALYRCAFKGYQDTLYAHSFRQFYRECDISGTIDFIFGNAAVIFQGCRILSRMPLPGQSTVITAQSRGRTDENTGFSIQNCSIIATEDLANSPGVKNFLGRPWNNYSRTVVIKSYIGGFIDPAGWTPWPGNRVDLLYYGEYENVGPGSRTDRRVAWPGSHLMNYSDAHNFTVSQFIT